MPQENDFQTRAVRATAKIHEHLMGPALRGQQLSLPVGGWDELCRVTMLLNLAHRRNWNAASHALGLDLDYAAGRLLRQIEALRHNVLPGWTPGQVASPSQILGDVLALASEFEAVEIDLKTRLIAVSTAPLVLEDVYLGAFRIGLSWERIGSDRPYDVVALDPHCAEGQDDVTHPHVRDQQLCEGDGAVPIRAALASGRVLDFFLLVRQVLQTYNPASAHVPLRDWSGSRSCSGCGCSISEDDLHQCDRCGTESCSDCAWGCHACGYSVCSECSADCAQCGLRFCWRCLPVPSAASRYVCQACLSTQQQELNDDSHQQTPETVPATS